MARKIEGLCTTRCQLFNDESTKNENNLRMKWFVKYRQRLLDNLQDDKLVERVEKIREKHMEERLKRRKEELEILKKDKPLPVWRLPKPDGTINLDAMKPFDQSVREILYEKGVSSFTTANNYLRERYKDKPEERYYFPDCTNWLHGWRLNDYPPVPSTKFGKSSIIRETFYRRHGASMKRDDSKGRFQTFHPKDLNDLLLD